MTTIDYGTARLAGLAAHRGGAGPTGIIDAVITSIDDTPLLAEHLSAKHIGAKVTVSWPNGTYTGYISDIRFDVERYIGGFDASGVRVEFQNDTITLPLGAKVEVLG